MLQRRVKCVSRAELVPRKGKLLGINKVLHWAFPSGMVSGLRVSLEGEQRILPCLLITLHFAKNMCRQVTR